jgi:hypothetical protein
MNTSHGQVANNGPAKTITTVSLQNDFRGQVYSSMVKRIFKIISPSALTDHVSATTEKQRRVSGEDEIETRDIRGTI